ncbi:hypothetical protein QMT40_002845 [Parvibaculaceae bacterium PLY_AMNH_Bact1]|nr:hypothetical protein QMT40_002845 [Parvibaculaceae bacterium PLY_AMNH_Bact1]
MFAGGIADKLGNRYEAKWLVCQLLDVIRGKAQWLRFEGINRNFEGFEFSIARDGIVEWHQTKVNNQNGNWTLNSLNREGVLPAFKERLGVSSADICVFVSQDPAKDIATLADKARVALSVAEYQETLGDGHAEKFRRLQDIWQAEPATTFSWLKRCYFRTESQPTLESLIASFSDFCFFNARDTTFALLRDFLEARFNKLITTESAKADLRREEKLVLQDWMHEQSVPERLATETKAYLDTYIPFDAGGETVPRSDASELMERIADSDGPQVLLLTGIAGSGKSGVLRQLIEMLSEQSIPHLALRIDQHLGCTSPRSLGKEVTGREVSPAATLKRTAKDQRSVLIVDQVDAVSEVAGRSGTVKEVVLRLVEDVRNFGNMVIVVGCRTFDLENDQRLKMLKGHVGVEHVNVEHLSWEQDVQPLLQNKSIDADAFSEKQRDLLCLPLNLAIFLEVSDGGEPLFASRNDLFAELVEKKGRSIRRERQVPWDIMAPLTELANWMSEEQGLDAPEDVLSSYSGARDILSSEGLIVFSRGRLNFFHESFFDYVYSRTFASRRESLVSLLLSSEQHLFRRTQVRQILETLRQIDEPRYLLELRSVLNSENIRYHIKTAVAQWLGSLLGPKINELQIVIGLDEGSGKFSSLVRHVLFRSPGWFDLLYSEGWVQNNLAANNPDRTDGLLRWLPDIAGDRPAEVAQLLGVWWGGEPERGKRLLDWFGLVKRKKPDDALVDLCVQVILSNPPGQFGNQRYNGRSLLFHTWASENPRGAEKILQAYFSAWFDANPGQHPFERTLFRDIDEYSLRKMSEIAPATFVEGTRHALRRSVDQIVDRERRSESDYSFRLRFKTGHHSGSDSFLDMFRSALRKIAEKSPDDAERYLHHLPPRQHVVFTHIWLETIAANGCALGHLLPELFDCSHTCSAGWQGAEWQSFADSAREALPFLDGSYKDKLTRMILELKPEQKFASEIVRDIQNDGEKEPWQTRKAALYYLRQSGNVQLCILETIGEPLLTNELKDQLQQLRRKFPGFSVPAASDNEARWVGPPIMADRVAQMNSRQWLSAMAHYDGDEHRRRDRGVLEGGATQLAQELQNLAKEQPDRFVSLMDQIPSEANHTYITHLMWGIAEAEDLDRGLARRAILDAHHRPGRPFGGEIIRLIQKHPKVAAASEIFEILTWYLANGEASDDGPLEASDHVGELVTIDDLLSRSGRIHVRGINGVRGAAAEALGAVLWEVPGVRGEAWRLIERRIQVEPLESVRCCLVYALTPLFNGDERRCAELIERLVQGPGANAHREPVFLERRWLDLAFSSENLPVALGRTLTWCAGKTEALIQRRYRMTREDSSLKWLSPLLTHQGVYLVPFLLRTVPEVGDRLLFRLIVRGDDLSRLIGAWFVFQLGFHDARYAQLADALAEDGVVYRRLHADIAARTLVVDEYRYRAEKVLRESFDDEDEKVRAEAAEVFRNIKPDEFERYKNIAYWFLESKALGEGSWAFFDALEKAECKVDDIVIAAAEKLIDKNEREGAIGGELSMDLHQLQEILKKEYTSSESNSCTRRHLLDLIDRMLRSEVYGVDAIIVAHER